MAFVCCSGCGYTRRERRRFASEYGGPAGICPNCELRMYWTDWLDPRRFERESYSPSTLMISRFGRRPSNSV